MCIRPRIRVDLLLLLKPFKKNMSQNPKGLLLLLKTFQLIYGYYQINLYTNDDIKWIID